VYVLRIVGLRLVPAPSDWTGLRVDLEPGIAVETWGQVEEDAGLYIPMVAEAKLKHPPKVTSDNKVVVPDRERGNATAAIEVIANAVSVATGSRRSISSPNPYVAFKFEDEEERDWLLKTDGILGGLDGQARGGVGIRLPLDSDLLNSLDDRRDGVALLAEATAHTHATGQFHEYLRLFERAFATAGPLLPAPMTAFLNPLFGYTEAEITTWTETLRHPATHADVRPGFVLEGDTRPVVGRMQQAAYDVLLNKKVWRDSSTERRDVWEPEGGTKDASSTPYMYAGSTGSLIGELSDRWGDYPLDMRRLRLPEGCWPPAPQTIMAAEGPLEVIARPGET
jgi:hypothetical protein